MTEELIFVVPQSYLSESRSESLRDVNVKKLSDGYNLAGGGLNWCRMDDEGRSCTM